MYGTRKQSDLQNDLREFNEHIQAAFTQRMVSPEAMHVFRSVLSTLRRTTG